MSGLDQAQAADLLEAFTKVRSNFDGDAWVDLFTDDVEWHGGPFGPVRRGLVELRRVLLDAFDREEQVEFTFERHWVVPPTILAPWHASYVDRASRRRIRSAGFSIFEVAADGRIHIARWWEVPAPT